MLKFKDLQNVDEMARAVGLKFRKVRRDELDELNEKLFIAGEVLHVRPKIVASDMKVLENPLTQQQKNILAENLNSIYGSFFADLQDALRPVRIIESGDKMVDLKNFLTEHGISASFSNKPINSAAGKMGGKPKLFWVRERVAEKWVRIGLAFNRIGLAPHFEDAFRPDGVQEGLFQTIMNRIADRRPHLSDEQLLAEARSMVAIAPWMAGHKSGAAVDYTLRTLEGESLDLGHNYLSLGAQVAVDYPFLTWDQYRTRKIFSEVSQMGGFTVYPGEDWHISWGDLASFINHATEDKEKSSTIYGPIKSFDPQTGEIDPYSPEDYYKTFEFRRS